MITHKDAVDVAELANEISQDGLVYRLIVALADTLLARRSNRFTPQQKADLTQRIEQLISCKFPDKDNISHPGYAIASEAHLMRIKRARGKAWRNLVERAQSIPNKSDLAFVLATIGKALPDRETKLRNTVFQQAIQVCETIPCNYDRISRLNDLAEMMSRKSRKLAQKCLSDAIGGLKSAEDGTRVGFFRDLIDTAFKIDEEFAASLVSITDDDPARAIAQHEMKSRLDTLRTRQAIMDGPIPWDRNEPDKPDLPRSSWLALGSLNAGRAHPSALEQLRPALRAASGYALSDAFPILAWVIENVVRKYSGSRQSRATIRSIFEGAVRATELAEIAGSSVSVAVRRDILRASDQTSDASVEVGVGERDQGLEFLSRWLEQLASERIYICDQYFGPSELDLLKLVQSVVPEKEIVVLTSRYHHTKCEIGSLREAYRAGWQKISDQSPPIAEIVVVGTEGSGKSPIHDRSILTEQSGVSIGTSWNSLGVSQKSTIRVLPPMEASNQFDSVAQFALERRREHGGERLLYDTITL